jgi:hypothetical protein
LPLDEHRRTSGFAEICETASVTSRPRIAVVASTPSTITLPSSIDISTFGAIAATSSRSPSTTPRRSAANVIARYIAPVSR